MRTRFIEGKNILLSPLSKDNDLKNYLKWINNQETVLFMESGRFPLTVGGLKSYIDSYNNSKDGMLMGIFLKKSLRHIGNIILHKIDWRNRNAEIGLLIGDKKSRGKGYATEAIKLIVEHAFNRLNLHKFYTGMVESNKPSKRAFEKVGFKIEGRLRKHFYLNDTYLDCYRMGLLREEYKGKTLRK